MSTDQIQYGWLPWRRLGLRAAGTSLQQTSAVDRRLGSAYAVLSIIALIPMFVSILPPCIDLPNHIARIHILATIGTDVDLQANYSAVWNLRTYFLPDLLLVGLAKVLPILWVGKVYILAAVGGLAASTWFLSKSLLGRPSIWCFASLLFLFSHPLGWGFINFLLGTSLAFVTFGLWLRTKGEPSLGWLVGLVVLTLSTYLTHIVAVAVLGLLMGSHTLQAKFAFTETNWRSFVARCLRIACCFAIPFALALTKDVNETVRTGPTVYGSLADKLRAFFSPTMISGHWIELTTMMFVVVVAYLLISRKYVSIERSAIGPLTMLTAVAIAMPLKLTGVFGLDFRLPVVVCLLFVASIREQSVPRKAKNVILACGLFLFVVRIGVLTLNWQTWNQDVQELQVALQTIDKGSRLITAGTSPARYAHLNGLAAIERSAFVPTLFTGATLLRPSSETAEFDTPCGMPLPVDQLKFPTAEGVDGYHSFYWGDWQHDFDYVLCFEAPVLDHSDWGELLFRGSYFSIHEISKR